MPKERKRNSVLDIKKLSLEQYLKKIPPPPPEHAHELKMEKRVKQLIEENKKRQ